MNFKKTLISGEFLKRYKRFFVDIKIKKNVITAHCPNTGSMMGLLKTGNKVWVSKSDDPKRKLKYTLQVIEDRKSKVGINTHLSNKIVFEALKNKSIREFKNIENIKCEVKFGIQTRFDFLIFEKRQKSFIEVKNVTLCREKGKAEFPDAVTSRGLKHINELINAAESGYKVYLLFLIQRDDCNFFEIAKDIDPKYYQLLVKAAKKKLNILCYDCKFSSKGIKLNRKINFKI
ncbi:DNA/RNA nuclease SfsA [Candidatus Pelagibacter bacterium]|nr:DNA/RNA nuclease SfsA [Candidatus Pelagibacter bacterium]